MSNSTNDTDVVESGLQREATRDDTPHGAEAQCPICWRIFTRDSVCEKHKPYATPKTVECKNPTDLDFVPHDRRGVTVWSGPAMPAGVTFGPAATR